MQSKSSINECPIGHSSQLANPFLGLPLEMGKCESCGTAEPQKCEGMLNYSLLLFNYLPVTEMGYFGIGELNSIKFRITWLLMPLCYLSDMRHILFKCWLLKIVLKFLSEGGKSWNIIILQPPTWKLLPQTIYGTNISRDKDTHFGRFYSPQVLCTSFGLSISFIDLLGLISC